jgi:hypothetical protein
MVAYGGLFALCCGLPLALAAGISAGFAGYLVGGILMAVFGGLAGIFMVIALLARRSQRLNSAQVEALNPEVERRIEAMRKSEGK